MASDSLRKAEYGTLQLEETQRLISDTTAVGEEVMSTMEAQREKLETSVDRLDETHGFVAEARRTMRRMYWRSVKEKSILWVVIVALTITDCALFYHYFLK